MDGTHTDEGWRVKCPRGHTRLRRLSDGRYYCRSCAESGDPYYEPGELVG